MIEWGIFVVTFVIGLSFGIGIGLLICKYHKMRVIEQMQESNRYMVELEQRIWKDIKEKLAEERRNQK